MSLIKTVPITSVGGSDTQVQFNSGGSAFGGDSGFTFNATTNITTITGGIITPKIYPSSDSTTAFQINKADGSTNVLNVDTTNSRLGIGTTTPTTLLELGSGQLSLPVGSVSAPSLTFAGDLNTGIYGVGADDMGLAAGGVKAMDITSSGIINRVNMQWNAGSVGEAGLGIAGDFNTGFYSPGADTIGINTGGAERVRVDSAGNVGIGVTTVTGVLHIKAGTAAASTAPLKFTSGTNLTTPEAGAVEWDGTNLYITQTGGTRKTIAYV